jgi:hypothetical protein
MAKASCAEMLLMKSATMKGMPTLRTVPTAAMTSTHADERLIKT